jgi:hypothetical protein
MNGVVSDPAGLLRRLRTRAAAAGPASPLGARRADPPGATKLKSAPPEGSGAAAVHSSEVSPGSEAEGAA